MKKIPNHLKEYIVNQEYSKYTYIDQACWRFIMSISVDFFQKNAEKIYLSGLQKTGITVNKIPKINNINKKLSKFGWAAVCVRGFIPPQAFMEFQSLKILPIAADMRTYEHLTYTPSPDIVHEAAGHAPIIANKDYAEYLINYGEVSSKAIISSEDINLFYAIRNLSDIKENTNSSKKDIKNCELKLQKAYEQITYTSESSLLSRMNWWTVEYGLIGNIENPKIYGAGLLSSVSESENCLKKEVKKIPLSLDCLNYKYDITEQQPQLFVTPNFKYLTKLLNKLCNKMSFKKGGIFGLNTAKKAKTLCTIELDSLIQISGIVDNYVSIKNNINFIKLSGFCQLSINNKELNGHGIKYHNSGYSTPLGNLKKYKKSINKLSTNELGNLLIKKNQNVNLIFESNIIVCGTIINILTHKSKVVMITFTNCTVKQNNKILFLPEWGNFDMVCGSKITSVFGGPADSINYYKTFKNKRYKIYNSIKKLPENLSIVNSLFKQIEKINNSEKKLYNLYEKYKNKSKYNWLFEYQFLIKTNCNRKIKWINVIYLKLEKKSKNRDDLGKAIKRGLELFN